MKTKPICRVLANSKRLIYPLGADKGAFVAQQLYKLSERIYKKGLDNESGNAHEYGKNYKNDVFEMFPYHDCCSCGSATKKTNDLTGTPHKEDCIGQKPNFKCGDVEIRWYKYIGRMVESNKIVSISRYKEIFEKCKKSLQ